MKTEADASKTTELTTTLLFLLVFLLLIGLAIEARHAFQIKQSYGLESKILLTQLQEQQKLAEKTNWDLNEYLAIKNTYIEKKLNLLLQYQDQEMQNLVKSQEQCFKTLLQAKEADDMQKFDETANTCNEIGELINQRHMQLLQEKTEGTQ